MKKVRWMILTVVLLMTLAGGAIAAPGWYSCTVTAVGPALWGTGSGVVYIRITDTNGAFTNLWMMASSDATACDRTMATALTAMSSGKKVVVYADASIQFSVLQCMYLVADAW